MLSYYEHIKKLFECLRDLRLVSHTGNNMFTMSMCTMVLLVRDVRLRSYFLEINRFLFVA